MPRFKSSRSLRTLCLESIAEHLDDIWCVVHWKKSAHVNQKGQVRSLSTSPYLGLFDVLSQACAKDLARLVVSRRVTVKIIHIHALIVPQLKEIDYSGCPNQITDDILELVVLRCRGVVKINLANCHRISSTVLKKFIQAFHETLEILVLSGIIVTGRVFKTIGQFCRNLLILSIDCCKVTTHGVNSMFYSNSEKSLTPAAKNLKVVRMMRCDFEDDVDLIADLLLRCPQLQYLTHFKVWHSIARLCEEHSAPPPLGLTGALHIMPLYLAFFNDNRSVIPRLAECLPKIKHVTVYSVSPSCMEMELIYFLKGCPRGLKSLELYWPFPYGFLHFLGFMFPDLESLSVNLYCPIYGQSLANIFQVFVYYVSERDLESPSRDPWRKLERLSLYFEGMVSITPSSSILLEIFECAAPSLSYLEVHSMPDPGADQMVLRALERNYFENLKVFRMRFCHLTVETVRKLIVTAPVLRLINFSGCQKIQQKDFHDVKEFVKVKNFDIEVEDDFNFRGV